MDEAAGTRSGADQPACVLVVEDDGALCGYLAECLAAAGFRAVRAANGLEGLRALEEHDPDVLVVDLDMPVMSGFRLLRLARPAGGASAYSPRLVVMTGYDLQEIPEVVRDVRPECYLQKPFAGELLVARVREILGPRR